MYVSCTLPAQSNEHLLVSPSVLFFIILGTFIHAFSKMWSHVLHNTHRFACVSSHHIAQPMTQEVQLVLPICTWVWCHSVEHGNPSSDHISKGELFFPKETTPCPQHFSKEWGWCFSTQSMLRFWFLCRIYESNHSCCEFTPVAPQTSFCGTPLPSTSLALQSFLPSLLQHSLSLPWSRVGVSLVH